MLDEIDISHIEKNYQGGGATSYSPRMLLKILVFAYMNNVYSSRRIENLAKENIYYMWLSCMQKPDHNTINRFRGKRLGNAFKVIFANIVLLLHQEDLLDIKEIYTDGTKLEVNASKYSFVWGRSIQKRKEKIFQQVNELWQDATAVATEEKHNRSNL